jgi:hypothetical protein
MGPMSDLPESLPELVALLEPPTAPIAAKALEAITKKKGKRTTRVLATFLLDAPAGLMATRAAMELEKRKDEACLPTLYEVYEKRKDLAEDIIPILSALEDPDGVGLVVVDLRELMSGPARLSTLAYMVKLADHEALADLLLPLRFGEPIRGADDDMSWALQQILHDGGDELLLHIGETAKAISPEAFAFVEPYMPAKSELEEQAPRIAAAFLTELERLEIIELVPGSEAALVEVLANTICEARSPKGLIKDVERILINSTAVEELFGDRDDIRNAFAKVTGN